MEEIILNSKQLTSEKHNGYRKIGLHIIAPCNDMEIGGYLAVLCPGPSIGGPTTQEFHFRFEGNYSDLARISARQPS
jgi:hypothetical protein